MKMKTILFLFAILIFGLASCSTRNVAVQQAENQAEEGVVINGVRWATRNVETPGRFASHPQSTGGFFTFDDARNACPPGWRLPTARELGSLGDGRRVNNRYGINGRTFGIEPNTIFLPAAGRRRHITGTSEGVGRSGWYWSSSPIDLTRATALVGRNMNPTARGFWLSVRCVAE